MAFAAALRRAGGLEELAASTDKTVAKVETAFHTALARSIEAQSHPQPVTPPPATGGTSPLAPSRNEVADRTAEPTRASSFAKTEADLEMDKAREGCRQAKSAMEACVVALQARKKTSSMPAASLGPSTLDYDIRSMY